MKIIALILLSSLFSVSEDKFYHNREMKCSFSYTITKDSELRLGKRGMFQLIVQVKDTRKKDVIESTYRGTWENNGDTIILNAVSPGSASWYWMQTKYRLENNSLKIINENTCLPGSFSFGRMVFDK